MKHQTSLQRIGRLAAMCALLLGHAGLAAEELVISDHAIVNTGHHIYMRSCAVCHGPQADGNGPFANLLVTPPPALNGLAKAHGGQFPFEHVLETISGNELMLAHGTRDMPIWGQAFAAEAATTGLDAATIARGRILELMAYLEHIQQPEPKE